MKVFHTFCFIFTRLFVFGFSLLIFNTIIVANELPEIDYYNSIDLIKDISDEYTENIGTILKKQTTRKKSNNKKFKTSLVNKNVRRRRAVLKRQVNVQKTYVAKRQSTANKKSFRQPIVYEANNCKDQKTSIPLRNEIQTCFDVATDVSTYNRPVNLNSEYLSLELNSKPLDLGIVPLDTRKIMLFGKNVNILDR